MARHVGAGITPDVRMFADLFRIIAEHELSVPPEVAAAFRALATIEGTLTQLVLAFLAATLGVMSVLMLGLHGGPRVTHSVTLYAFFGYCLLVFAGVLALRALVLVFRSDTG